MAEALQHLHERGIAHMDVKPDNIYADAAGSGRFKLGDFGLATARSGKGFCQEGDARCPRCILLLANLSALLTSKLLCMHASEGALQTYTLQHVKQAAVECGKPTSRSVCVRMLGMGACSSAVGSEARRRMRAGTSRWRC
jgi:serine/threonine protein kinase